MLMMLLLLMMMMMLKMRMLGLVGFFRFRFRVDLHWMRTTTTLRRRHRMHIRRGNGTKLDALSVVMMMMQGVAVDGQDGDRADGEHDGDRDGELVVSGPFVEARHEQGVVSVHDERHRRRDRDEDDVLPEFERVRGEHVDDPRAPGARR